MYSRLKSRAYRVLRTARILFIFSPCSISNLWPDTFCIELRVWNANYKVPLPWTRISEEEKPETQHQCAPNIARWRVRSVLGDDGGGGAPVYGRQRTSRNRSCDWSCCHSSRPSCRLWLLFPLLHVDLASVVIELGEKNHLDLVVRRAEPPSHIIS